MYVIIYHSHRTLYFAGGSIKKGTSTWRPNWISDQEGALQMEKREAEDHLRFIEKGNPLIKGLVEIVEYNDISKKDAYSAYNRAMKGGV